MHRIRNPDYHYSNIRIDNHPLYILFSKERSLSNAFSISSFMIMWIRYLVDVHMTGPKKTTILSSNFEFKFVIDKIQFSRKLLILCKIEFLFSSLDHPSHFRYHIFSRTKLIAKKTGLWRSWSSSFTPMSKARRILTRITAW